MNMINMGNTNDFISIQRKSITKNLVNSKNNNNFNKENLVDDLNQIADNQNYFDDFNQEQENFYEEEYSRNENFVNLEIKSNENLQNQVENQENLIKNKENQIENQENLVNSTENYINIKLKNLKKMDILEKYSQVFKFFDEQKATNNLFLISDVMSRFGLSRPTALKVIKKYLNVNNLNFYDLVKQNRGGNRKFDYEKIFEFLFKHKMQGNLKSVLNTQFLRSNFNTSNGVSLKIIKKFCKKYNLNYQVYLNITKIDYESIFDFIQKQINIGNADKINTAFLVERLNLKINTAKIAIVKFCQKNNLNPYQFIRNRSKIADIVSKIKKIHNYFDNHKNQYSSILKSGFLKRNFDCNYTFAKKVIKEYCIKNNLDVNNYCLRKQHFDYNEILNTINELRINQNLKDILNTDYLSKKFNILSQATANKIIHLFCERFNLNINEFIRGKSKNYNEIYNFLDEHSKNNNLINVLNNKFLCEKFNLSHQKSLYIIQKYCIDRNLNCYDFIQKRSPKIVKNLSHQ